jgi:hypothetical protein
MKQQSKREQLPPVLMETADGAKQYAIEVERELIRAQYTDGTWSEWAPGNRTFTWRRSPVHPEPDGTFRIAVSGTVIRPVNPELLDPPAQG